MTEATDETFASKYPINEFGGFRIMSINPIRMIRIASGREITYGNNKQHLRGMALRLGLFQAGKHELVDTSGRELTTQGYATTILKKLNDH